MKRIYYIIGFLFLLGLYFYKSGLHEFLLDIEGFNIFVKELGVIGPFVIVGLMVLAIVFSPLPSAPIALVAGAVYGHLWGTLYILIGAEIGALIAFSLSRHLGHQVLSRWVDTEYLSERFVGSQNVIMGIVFFSRLLPFVSFDLVSYAAGLSSISILRFAIATLAGIIPASFLLAHFGEELSIFSSEQILLSIVIIAAMIITTIVLKRNSNK